MNLKRDARILLGVALVMGCGGDGSSNRVADRGPQTVAERAIAAAAGPISETLAAQGESLFVESGCNACHKIGGGRLVGPDLLGVTGRRRPDFIVGMILNPDSMLVNDEDAKALLAEYLTPMANQGLAEDQALALFEYLRRADSNAGE